MDSQLAIDDNQLPTWAYRYPVTLRSGMKLDVWDDAEVAVIFGMPAQEVTDLLRELRDNQARIEIKLDTTLQLQSPINTLVADMSRTLYGTDDQEGLRNRMKKLEEWRNEQEDWYAFLRKTIIGAFIIAAVGGFLAWLGFKKE